jgi:hypothetical protein
MLSPYLISAGIGLASCLWSRQSQREQIALNDEIRTLVFLLRCRLVLGESAFAALASIRENLAPGRTRRIVHRVVDIYQAKGNADEALATIQEMRNPYLLRVSALLGVCNSAGTDIIIAELKELENDLKVGNRLVGQTASELAPHKSTMRLLHAANLTVIVVSAVLPFWHEFSSGTIQRKGILLVTTMLLALVPLYFDRAPA